MSTKSSDLWPTNLETHGPKAPAAILREQGGLLGRKTNNLVVGVVVPEPGEPRRPAKGLRSLPFCYSFFLEAPALDRYRFKLFTISHRIILYPVFVSAEDGGKPRVARSETEFLQVLKDLFSSAYTKQAIESLIAQSQVAV